MFDNKEISFNEEETSVVENFESFEEVEDIVTANDAGTIGCGL